MDQQHILPTLEVSSNLYWIQGYQCIIPPWMWRWDYTFCTKFRKKRNEKLVQKITYCSDVDTLEKFRVIHYPHCTNQLWVHETGTFSENRIKPIIDSNSQQYVQMDAYCWKYIGTIVKQLDVHTYIVAIYDYATDVYVEHLVQFTV